MMLRSLNRFLAACLFVGLAAGSLSFAADFWTNPDFMKWEEKDARKLLSSSPWAAEYAIPDPNPGRANAGGRGQIALQTFTVMWRSSTPIKRALVRLMSPSGITPQAQEFLDRPEPTYVVGVAAVKQFFGPVTTDVELLKSYASLQIKGQPARKPVDVALQGDQAGISINYQFSRDKPITLDDKDVEFVFEMPRAPTKVEKTPRPLVIKRKFTLKSMVFDGKLDL